MAIVDLTDNAVARICGHMISNCEAKVVSWEKLTKL